MVSCAFIIHNAPANLLFLASMSDRDADDIK